MPSALNTALRLILTAATASAHVALWHPSMWGFNQTNGGQIPVYGDNRAVAPLYNRTFDAWWFHDHLDYPPEDGQFLELPAGGTANTQIACNKGYTDYWNTIGGNGDLRDGNYVCGAANDTAQFHTTGYSDVKGCGLGITYESDVSKVQPEDFAIFTVNQQCPWTLNTPFEVPAAMPACPPGGCICAFFWIHSPDSGSEQMYMNGFRCQVTGAKATAPVAQAQVARRCGADPINGKINAAPGNCTYGAKQPLYWLQAERNNMFEGYYAPPFYNDLYGFTNGAQNDIFEGYYELPLPVPGPAQTILPTVAGAAENTTSPVTSVLSSLLPSSTSARSSSSAPISSTPFAPSTTSTPRTSSSSTSAALPSSSPAKPTSSQAVTSAKPSSTSTKATLSWATSTYSIKGSPCLVRATPRATPRPLRFARDLPDSDDALPEPEVDAVSTGNALEERAASLSLCAIKPWWCWWC